MEDKEIIALFFERNEAAIAETNRKYGAYLHCVARNILGDDAFAEECVNDAYFKAWENIPPLRPERLGAWLGRLTRNIALNRLERSRAEKRGGGETDAAFSELEGCIPSHSPDIAESIAFKNALNEFLAAQSAEARRIFIQRYWYFLSIEEISKENGVTKSKVKSSLMRTRSKLRIHLEKEELLYEKQRNDR